MIRWDVDPEIFRIGFFALRWYSLLFMLSFIVGLVIFNWIYKQEKRNVADIDQFLIYMLLGTVIGARLGHCLFYDPAYYLSNPLLILKVWQGGLASHGAAIGILIAIYLYSRKKKDQPYLWILDRVVITVALAGFFIRLGNLFNSEICGKPTDAPWAFLFIRAKYLYEDVGGKLGPVPRHPTQLYEALAYLVIFVILFFIYKKYKANVKPGLLFGLFLVLVFGFRFFIEFTKTIQESFSTSIPLNMGQLLSIPLVLTGFYFIWYAFSKGRSSSA